MTKIERIDVAPFRIPLRSPVRFATGTLTVADHVLVRVTDSDGAVGTAEAIPRPMIHGETVGSTVAAYDGVITPLAVGRSLSELERIHEELGALVRNETAKAAFEIACLDLVAQRLGTSVHRLLGGYTDQLAVSAMLAYGQPGAVAEEALGHRDAHGIESFKLKVGRDLSKDLATCRSVREAVGPDALVYVDANHGYDALTALRFCEAAAELGIAWIEEPCPADDVVARRRLTRQSPLAVLADESAISPGDVAREVLDSRADMISLKVARSGRRDADRIRGFCETAGVPFVMGSQGDSGIGTLTSLAYAAAFASTSRYPAEYSYFLHLADDLLAETPRIAGGKLSVGGEPGYGINLDTGKLEHYRLP